MAWKQLVVSQACHGIGGAGLYSMAMVVVTENCSPKLILVVSTALGPVIAVAV
jgi:hypothetical protein